MMKEEFERMVGFEVLTEQFKNVIEPMYNATNLTKEEFVGMLNLDCLKKRETPIIIKKMCTRDNSGFSKTPNGCYYHIRYVKLVDVDVATGKYIVDVLPKREQDKLTQHGVDLYLSTDFDFDYTQCLEVTTNKPVKLK